MSKDYANHVQALRRRARRPDDKDRSGRGQQDHAAIEEYDDEVFSEGAYLETGGFDHDGD